MRIHTRSLARNLSAVVMAFGATLLAGGPAAAQDVATTLKSEANPPLKRTTFEILPLDALVAATPGIASGGASVESYLGRNFAAVINGAYADVDLPNKYVSTVTDETGNAMIASGYGYSAGLGLRYYDSPIGSSLYGGLGLDYSEALATWTRDGEDVRTRRFAVTPSLAAGYRWVRDNGLLFRLGAGAGLPSIQSQKVEKLTEGPDSDEVLADVEDTLDQKVLAKVDLGVGMMF